MKTSTVLQYLGAGARREMERQRMIQANLKHADAGLLAEFWGGVWMILTDAALQMDADDKAIEDEQRKSVHETRPKGGPR